MARSLRQRLISAGIPIGIAVAGLGMVGCGERTSALEQPHIGGERFTRITFEGLPGLRDATRLAYTKAGREHTEDLELVGATPGQVIAYFDETLKADGWAEQDELTETREGLLATWQRMGRSVAVLAALDEDSEGDEPVTLFTVSYLSIDRPGG